MAKICSWLLFVTLVTFCYFSPVNPEEKMLLSNKGNNVSYRNISIKNI